MAQFTTLFSLCLFSMERMSLTGAALAFSRSCSSRGSRLGCRGLLAPAWPPSAGLSLSTMSTRAFSSVSSRPSRERRMSACNEACTSVKAALMALRFSLSYTIPAAHYPHVLDQGTGKCFHIWQPDTVRTHGITNSVYLISTSQHG